MTDGEVRRKASEENGRNEVNDKAEDKAEDKAGDEAASGALETKVRLEVVACSAAQPHGPASLQLKCCVALWHAVCPKQGNRLGEPLTVTTSHTNPSNPPIRTPEVAQSDSYYY